MLKIFSWLKNNFKLSNKKYLNSSIGKKSKQNNKNKDKKKLTSQPTW